MDKEKEYFIDFKGEDLEESDISSTGILKIKSSPLSPRQKITGTVIVVIIFLLTAIFGYLSMNGPYEQKDETAASFNESASVTDAVTDKYKIKSFSFIENEEVIMRGRLNITKDDLNRLNNDELSELFGYISSLSDYNWTTISFSDGTGIFSLPGNKSVYLYGKLDSNGLIKDAFGTIIRNGKNEYIFISSDDSSTDTTSAITADMSNNETVYITASGTKYHLEGCNYLTESKTSISLNKAKEQGYLPCSRCSK